jgi:ATP-dependent Clp protease protease subunit
MFRKPHKGDAEQHLQDNQFEFSQAYLTRTKRMLFLRGPIFGVEGGMGRLDSFGPTMVGDDILSLNEEDPKAPIRLIIDSPGGDVGSGMVLYDIIRMSKAPVITIAQNCASMATVLMAAGSERMMFPHSRVMLHLPQGAFKGDSDTIEIRSKELSRVKNELIECYIDCGVTAGLPASKNGRPPAKSKVKAQIIKDINRSEYWMTAKECVKYGLVDRVATSADIFYKGAK